MEPSQRKQHVRSEAKRSLGITLRSLRQEPFSGRPRGLTLTQAAELIGVSASYLSQVERGVTLLSLRRLRLLADIYGAPYAGLLRLLGLQEFDWLTNLLPEADDANNDVLLTATSDERRELVSYLNYLRLKRSLFAGPGPTHGQHILGT